MLYLALFFTLGAGLFIFQYRHEQALRRKMLEMGMSTYAYVVSTFLSNHPGQYPEAAVLLPRGVRLTLLDRQGHTLFDNEAMVGQMENHRDRPEVQSAILEGHGNAIRRSRTTGIESFYHVEPFNDMLVRVTVPYGPARRNALATDRQFLYILILTCLAGLLIMLWVADRMGRGLASLREFIRRIDTGQSYTSIQMPEGEIGDIGRAVMHSYKLLEESNHRAKIEHEKLLQHFMHAPEGVALFDASRKLLYSNTRFAQFINLLREQTLIQLEHVLDYQEFKAVIPFIETATIGENQQHPPILELHLAKGAHAFIARVLIFPDRSFEIALREAQGEGRLATPLSQP